MKTVIFCFSDAGCLLAEKLRALLDIDASSVHTTEKFAGKYGFAPHKSVCADMGTLFSDNELLIFICACGIAVRDIAPHLKSKTSDPAVLCADDRGTFVIPILSGHIGGANGAARSIARLLGATAVITTATDVSGRFSCDEWAAENGCAISSMKLAKDVSAAILTREVGICSDYPLPDKLPDGLIRASEGDIGIYIGHKTVAPYEKTLRLVPKTITLGIGCRRGASAEDIRTAVGMTFADNSCDTAAIARVCSIDVKREETGLLEYAASLGVAPEFYSASELEAVDGEFAESEFVRKTVGVGNVCERAASTGGKLIIHKTALDGVTVAAALSEWSVKM